MSIADLVSEQILPRVRKPSRYLGTELNSVHKDPEHVAVRACLAFPDSYDLGLGNLGLQILYHILNQREDVWCERVCAPHDDLEAELRRRRLPLFSLESRTPLAEFDLLGFTLQWELNYTNILNMLDLGGVSILAEQRRDGEPIVIAGGPCVFNPEPLALFIDCFVIGDGEEVVGELVDAVRAGGGRRRVLERLAATPGCYVPSLYPMVESDRGVLVPPPDAPRITKRLVDLESQPFPTDYLVPYAEQVHDRVGLEVLRGCTQGCRFCQAGMVTRPVRERSLASLAELQQETMRKTGYEEISLVSLSTCDYSRVKGLVKQSVDLARPEHISVSLPSLRLDSFSVDLAHQISSIRKTGLTFAPEAATDRMRAVINKFITTEDLLGMAEQTYRHGWDQLKLYFMIGLPTETDEDVEAIGELATAVYEVGRQITRRARVNLGVSTFVPKPQTPFQWAEQIDADETRRRQQLLRAKLGGRGIKFGRHNPFHTYLEGVLTRADRRAGWLLYYAWQEGARFDGWDERDAANEPAWQRAFARWEAEHGLRHAEQLREREVAEPLPWDHIDAMIPKGWLLADWQRALKLDWAKDCRQKTCHQCGVIEQVPRDCTTMLKQSRQGARAEAGLELEPPPSWEEPPPVARLRMAWSRVGVARLLSHKEVLNVFIRALRRARVPMRYSEGYHPHAAVSFSAALPVGMETVADYLDVQVTEAVDPAACAARLNETLPEGFAVGEAWLVEPHAKALMALLDAHRYRVHVPIELAGDELEPQIAHYLSRPEMLVQRRGKQRGGHVTRPVDIRPNVAELFVAANDARGVTLEMLLIPHQGRGAKVGEVLASLFGFDDDALTRCIPRKIASYCYDDGALRPLRAPVGEPV